MRWPKLFRRKPTDLEIENAYLRAQLMYARVLINYFQHTRKPCDGHCERRSTAFPRHRWRTVHATTEVLTRRIR